MLHLRVTPLFATRGIDKPVHYLVKNGFTYFTAHRLVYGPGRCIRLDHIEKLCKLFKCEPHDLLYYTETSGKKSDPAQPITRLKQAGLGTSWKQNLDEMSLQQIKQIAETVLSNQPANKQ